MYLSTTTGVLTSDAAGRVPVSALVAKRGTDLEMTVMPDREIPAESGGVLAALAPSGGAPLALDAWEAPAAVGDGWKFSVSLRGGELAALFASGAGQVTLNAEATFEIGGKLRKSQTMTLTVVKEVYNQSPLPVDIVNVRRTNATGYQEYSFDDGVTWWRYAPVNVGGVPEWQWTYLGEDEE